MIRIALALILAATGAPAQTIDQNAPAIRVIMDGALAECRETTAPGVDLIVEPGAITWVDLDGGEEPNDAVIDFNRILCAQNFSLWHGSGGSVLHFVLNGEIARSWTGGYWRITEFGGSPLILIGRHGTWCDSFGARGCVQAIMADEEGFWAVQDGRALEDGGGSEN